MPAPATGGDPFSRTEGELGHVAIKAAGQQKAEIAMAEERVPPQPGRRGRQPLVLWA